MYNDKVGKILETDTGGRTELTRLSVNFSRKSYSILQIHVCSFPKMKAYLVMNLAKIDN